MKCAHCGLPHRSEQCNRPEGIAARGGVCRMHERSIGWASASRESVLRGTRRGGRVAWTNRRIKRAIG